MMCLNRVGDHMNTMHPVASFQSSVLLIWCCTTHTILFTVAMCACMCGVTYHSVLGKGRATHEVVDGGAVGKPESGGSIWHHTIAPEIIGLASNALSVFLSMMQI